jgi:hypothetical protein
MMGPITMNVTGLQEGRARFAVQLWFGTIAEANAMSRPTRKRVTLHRSDVLQGTTELIFKA